MWSFHCSSFSNVLLLWPPCIADAVIIFFPCGFFLSSSFVSSPDLSGRRLDVYLPYLYTWCGLGANLECRSEMCCTRLAENTGCKKWPSRHHCSTLSDCIFATKAHIDNQKKNLLHSNTSSICPHNMVNFSPLAAEIVSLVWGTPANFNGFCVLAALLQSTLVVGIGQTSRR